jgi:uncharacterized protein YbaR (Trm112 family)
MTLDNALLRILACPIDKRELLYFADEAVLYNPRLRRAYRIENGIPVMLVGRAEPIDEDEHERLEKRATCGDAVVTLGGQAK